MFPVNSSNEACVLILWNCSQALLMARYAGQPQQGFMWTSLKSTETVSMEQVKGQPECCIAKKSQGNGPCMVQSQMRCNKVSCGLGDYSFLVSSFMRYGTPWHSATSVLWLFFLEHLFLLIWNIKYQPNKWFHLVAWWTSELIGITYRMGKGLLIGAWAFNGNSKNKESPPSSQLLTAYIPQGRHRAILNSCVPLLQRNISEPGLLRMSWT